MPNQTQDNLNKEIILTFLRNNKNFLEKEFGITQIALFGSYARNEQKSTSDIDILIEMKQHDFKKRFYLKEYLEKSFGKKVDVGYISSIRSIVRRHIEKEIIYA